MRAVSGFERPVIQWLFIALGLLLIAVAGGAAWSARQARTTAASLQASAEGEHLERDRLEAQLARERAAREALALELERVRADADASQAPRVLPTLTLTPLTTRGSQPPSPTITAQHATQVIELRLILPSAVDKTLSRFDVTMRDWSTGALAWSRGGLTAAVVDGRRGLTMFITGDAIRAGTYELLLSGFTSAGQKRQVAAYEIAIK